jgi:hypothetical protein
MLRQPSVSGQSHRPRASVAPLMASRTTAIEIDRLAVESMPELTV